MQSLGFHLLALELTTRVVEVEYHAALLQFLDEQIVSIFRSDFWEIVSMLLVTPLCADR